MSSTIQILVFNTDKNGGGVREGQRKREITSFLRDLDPKPDFLLLQEVKLTEGPWTTDQRKYINEAIGEFIYNGTEQEEASYNSTRHGITWTTFNMIMYSNKYEAQLCTIDEEQNDEDSLCNCDPGFNPDPTRFRLNKFSFKGKNFLIVSFHGHFKLKPQYGKELKNSPRFRNIRNEQRQALQIKCFLLTNYLQFFHNIKEQHDCQFLIVGGDFNVNMDTFIKEETYILGSLNLKIVHHKKFDALICDNELTQVGDIITCNDFSDGTLNHFPFLCTLRIPGVVEEDDDDDELHQRFGAFGIY